MANKLEIKAGDAGQSVLRYLERRAGLFRTDVYRWLRTGEIRVNGGRAKAGRILAAGDVLRLPPQIVVEAAPLGICHLEPGVLGGDLPILFQDDNILVLDKPSGLATQGGSGQSDSVAVRIQVACGSGLYVPAPAHRLDKYASGLLVAGKNPAAQTRLHAFFREPKAELERSYYCWVRGNASGLLGEPRLLRDVLAPEFGADGRERMAVQRDAASGKEAAATYACLIVRHHDKLGEVSLLEAALITGRKHQIRVQLSSRCLPLIGDGRYGGPVGYPIFLHAWRLVFPALYGAAEAAEFTSLPRWTGFFAMGERNV